MQTPTRGSHEDGDVASGRAAPRRRWPWILATVLTVALTLVAAGVAFEQRQTAAAWRDRAEDLRLRLDAGWEREEVLSGQVAELTELLLASEADAVMLEERVRALADEKAQAEDTVTTVQVEREVFSDVTGRIAAAADALDACVGQLFALQTASAEAFNRSAAGEPVDVGPLNAQAERVTASCNDARGAAASAGAVADRLLGP